MFWRRRARLDEEMASHIAEETADNVARGMEPAAAREAALRSFGNVEAAKETVRERNAWYWLDTISQDVRFACRLIVRNPWLSATIIATLTTGIALITSADIGQYIFKMRCHPALLELEKPTSRPDLG